MNLAITGINNQPFIVGLINSECPATFPIRRDRADGRGDVARFSNRLVPVAGHATAHLYVISEIWHW